MTVLVTGAGGLIASRIVYKLVEQGEEVLAHPEVLDVRDDLVRHAEAPEKGPEHEDGQAEEAAAMAPRLAASRAA